MSILEFKEFLLTQGFQTLGHGLAPGHTARGELQASMGEASSVFIAAPSLLITHITWSSAFSLVSPADVFRGHP